MKKLILVFLLIKSSLFADGYSGGIGLTIGKFNRVSNLEIIGLSIVSNKVTSKYMINYEMAIALEMLSMIEDTGTTTIPIKGYAFDMSFTYEIYNKNYIFIAPKITLGYMYSLVELKKKEKFETSIPLSIDTMIGLNLQKNNFVFISYGIFNINLKRFNSSKSKNTLTFGISHKFNNSTVVSSSYMNFLSTDIKTINSPIFSISVGSSL